MVILSRLFMAVTLTLTFEAELEHKSMITLQVNWSTYIQKWSYHNYQWLLLCFGTDRHHLLSQESIITLKLCFEYHILPNTHSASMSIQYLYKWFHNVPIIYTPAKLSFLYFSSFYITQTQSFHILYQNPFSPI